MPLNTGTPTDAGVWHTWTTNSCSVTTQNQVYNTWVASGTTASTNAIYNTWVTQAALRTFADQAEAALYPAAKPSAKQIFVQKWNEFWHGLVRVFERAFKDTAKLRARKLLVEHLDAVQRASYEKDGHFVVEVQGVRYRIDQGTHGNVKELDAAGKPLASYCIQPAGVPDEDAMLAQKLQLEADVAAFKRVANRRPYYA